MSRRATDYHRRANLVNKKRAPLAHREYLELHVSKPSVTVFFYQILTVFSYQILFTSNLFDLRCIISTFGKQATAL